MSERDDYIDEAGYVLTAGVYGLSGAEFLADLSLGKIREAYNGIGPEWLPAQIREELNKHLGLFAVCAVIHDCRFAYDNDGSAAKFNAANDELERNCIIVDIKADTVEFRRFVNIIDSTCSFLTPYPAVETFPLFSGKASVQSGCYF